MTHPQIAIMNESTCLTDEQVKAVIPALQKQIDRDFAPVWGVSAELRFVAQGEEPSGGMWWLVFLDNPDQAGVMGYHDLTNGGLPIGKVFAKSDIDKGQSWTVTASHEILEMLVDPSINLTVIWQPESCGGLLYPYEVCDPCEADEHGYEIDGVTVADFVYPAWFEPFRPPGTRFDFQNKIQKPFELLPGGYIGVYDLASGSGWHQRNAQTQDPRAYQMRAQPGSRRERRRVPGSQWMVSAARRSRK